MLNDMFGASFGKLPKFSRNFLEDAEDVINAVKAYVLAVRNGSFPTAEHSF